MTVSTQKMIKFSVKAISNGFILDATYVIDESKDANNYSNHRFEKKYFAKVDVMCDYIKEYFDGGQIAG